MTVSGATDVAIVLRSGADSEMTSGLSREETRLISDAPGVARNERGPIASAELFVIIDLPKRSTGTDANVPFRGVDMQAFEVRGNVEIVQGRRFEPGRNEIIVGAGAAREFAGLDSASRFGSARTTGTSSASSPRAAASRNRKSGRTLRCFNRPTTAEMRSSRFTRN